MQRIVSLVVLLGACASSPSKASRAAPLACPCPPLHEEIATACKQPGTTARTGKLGEYTVLRVETDPTSFIYTSFTYYYDRTGALVGRHSFVNEYSHNSDEGIVPRGAPTTWTTVCPAAPATR